MVFLQPHPSVGEREDHRGDDVAVAAEDYRGVRYPLDQRKRLLRRGALREGGRALEGEPAARRDLPHRLSASDVRARNDAADVDPAEAKRKGVCLPPTAFRQRP